MACGRFDAASQLSSIPFVGSVCVLAIYSDTRAVAVMLLLTSTSRVTCKVRTLFGYYATTERRMMFVLLLPLRWMEKGGLNWGNGTGTWGQCAQFSTEPLLPTPSSSVVSHTTICMLSPYSCHVRCSFSSWEQTGSFWNIP